MNDWLKEKTNEELFTMKVNLEYQKNTISRVRDYYMALFCINNQLIPIIKELKNRGYE